MVGNGSEGDGDRNNRPDNNDGNWRQPSHYPAGERDKYPSGNDRPPPGRDRYPTRDGQYDRYPMDRPNHDSFGMDGYPVGRPGDRDYERDRFPPRDGPYPPNRYPMSDIPEDYGKFKLLNISVINKNILTSKMVSVISHNNIKRRSISE